MAAEDTGAYLGEIRLFAGGFAPDGWLDCDGRLLDIKSHTALYSLLGATYGKEGSEKFALPDLRGRAPIGIGPGPGLSEVVLGEKGGAEQGQSTTTLNAAQIPAHPHDLNVSTLGSDGSSPGPTTLLSASILDSGQATDTLYRASGSAPQTAKLNAATISSGSKPPDPVTFNLPTRSPFLGLRYIICITGLYPMRPTR